MRNRRLALLLILPLLLLAGCGLEPLRRVAPEDLPVLTDDLATDSLEAAIAESLRYLDSQPPEKSFALGRETTSAARLAASLRLFLEIRRSATDETELRRLLAERFTFYKAAGRSAFLGRKPLLVTGYYEPVLEGRLSPEPPFVHPLYALPGDLEKETDPASGETRTVRRIGGRTEPYPSRAEIENNNLLAGSELVYLADPVDAFVLHVQGSGKIRLADGSLRSIGFAGKNGRPYRSIGRLLADEGKIPLAEVTMPRIRHYLDEHPEERQRILQHNQSFIFFAWKKPGNPAGNLGRPLTPLRSAAVDQTVFPAAGLAFLQSRRPVFSPQGELESWQPISRFVLLQDTGSAIKGAGRLDLFWGNGPEAEQAAGVMKEQGSLYLLLLKADGD